MVFKYFIIIYIFEKNKSYYSTTQNLKYMQNFFLTLFKTFFIKYRRKKKNIDFVVNITLKFVLLKYLSLNHTDILREDST